MSVAVSDVDPLIQVEDKDSTPLRHLSPWVIYRLMRQGKLEHVKVGRRRYLTAAGIAKFIAAGGELAAPAVETQPTATSTVQP